MGHKTSDVIDSWATVSTPFRAHCPAHGLVADPQIAENPHIRTVHCPECFELLGVQLLARPAVSRARARRVLREMENSH